MAREAAILCSVGGQQVPTAQRHSSGGGFILTWWVQMREQAMAGRWSRQSAGSGQSAQSVAGGGLSRQSWGDRAEGVSRVAGCLQVPANWGHVWRDRFSQALASSHTALPACLVWATNSLLFFLYNDSFENLISKGNCVNVNPNCEAQACVSTHASPVMGCSKNTPWAHCTGTEL